ncbi:helix-turn-helix transcriptional regulator [Bradyrhizobium cajani]|uniref:Helix-turn-helix domain-containing protein n=1 Tax=Bradyrhizobium cajani TaxID=1928661 RepID=A0A844T617_9BRAD|nr:AraC family transcriptional regulator [Bradyrhizobium cajani]MCP3368040.1 AraC family transcriptional regulator [Bradyrhizobium cajani]MVT71869.1 helix-turn-helix domain-containing protein [Bradyrhizobium cajani]
MSQPSPSRQPKHGHSPTTVIADDRAADLGSAVATPSIASLPEVVGPGVVPRRDDLSARDATTIAFERLGLVLAIEPQLLRGSWISPHDRVRDNGWLRIEVPRQRASGTISSPAAEVLVCNEDDPVVRRLSEAAAVVERLKPAHGTLCVDALRLAVVARLFALQPDRQPELGERARAGRCVADKKIRGLQKWRLKRVLGYIEAHFCKKIPLADLAAVAGLSRMHFAAQFRVAMGCSPHEYILHRRILRAKDLLRNCEMPIVEVALSVGFQSQAHFTTTFRRFAGNTPSRWRDAAAAGFDL